MVSGCYVGAGGNTIQPVNTIYNNTTYNNTGWGNTGGRFSSPPYGGGGGGAGGVGRNANQGTSGLTTIGSGQAGGPGKYYGDVFGDIYGEDGWFAQGGHSADFKHGIFDVTDQKGGGGYGRNDKNDGESGMANTGGGAGSNGLFGGSGIVIIKYTIDRQEILPENNVFPTFEIYGDPNAIITIDSNTMSLNYIHIVIKKHMLSQVKHLS